jgi:hypothetical protein
MRQICPRFKLRRAVLRYLNVGLEILQSVPFNGVFSCQSNVEREQFYRNLQNIFDGHVPLVKEESRIEEGQHDPR